MLGPADGRSDTAASALGSVGWPDGLAGAAAVAGCTLLAAGTLLVDRADDAAAAGADVLLAAALGVADGATLGAKLGAAEG